jgi:hypothetical protein
MSLDLKFLIRESIGRLLEEDVKFAEGETVKTTDGKKGEITLAKHPFYAISLSDGSTRSYHFSDLIKGVQEKMEYKGDKKDLSPALEFHIKNGLSLFENVFRPESKAYFDLFNEARKLYNEGLLKLTKEEIELLKSDIGETIILENKTIYLGLPFLGESEFNEGTFDSEEHIAIFSGPDGEADVYKRRDGSYYAVISGEYDYDMVAKDAIEMAAKLKRDGLTTRVAGQLNEAENKKKDPPIGKPKRGGSKKFYVYVKNPKTKKIKKVSFGDTTGLRAKLNNPKARKAFAARHKCAQKKDRTKASYWSCRLPRYAKLLGFKTTFSGYW